VTSIEWAANPDGTPGEVWNCVRGCSHASDGCKHCYAERMAGRFSKEGLPYHGLVTEIGSRSRNKYGAHWTGEVRCLPEMLDRPLRWRKPRTVFCNSMSDLFHEKVPLGFIIRVFAIMAACPQHKFIALTKRPQRMSELLSDKEFEDLVCDEGEALAERHQWCHAHEGEYWPLPNFIPGVSCENQEQAEKRILWLLDTPAATRIVSAEPLLSEINFWDAAAFGESQDAAFGSKIDGMLVGCESGPGARPCEDDWVRSIRDQCAQAGVAFFLK